MPGPQRVPSRADTVSCPRGEGGPATALASRMCASEDVLCGLGCLILDALDGGGGCSSREQVCTRGILKSKHEDLLAATWLQGEVVDPSL